MAAPSAKYVSGDVQSLTYQLSAAAAVAVGECTKVGNLLLISHGGKGAGLQIGDVDERAYQGGIYDVLKDAGTDFTDGATVYVDIVTGLAVTASSADTIVFGPANGATPTNATVVRAAHVALTGA